MDRRELLEHRAGSVNVIEKSFALLLVVLLVAACGGRVEEPAAQAGDPPYPFADPDVVFRLPPELEEISGLTVLEDGHLAAVQDEDGLVFIIDAEDGRVVRTVSFAGDGDYEGITRVEDAIFVVRSDGTLFQIRNLQGEPETEEHPTDLHKDCDAEGLTYDDVRARLLIACKESAGEDLDGKKAVYAYDLDRLALTPEPAIVIDVDSFLVKVEERHPLNRGIRSLISKAVDLSGFSPSGIAIHPQTRQLYVLSARRRAVVVMDLEGDIANVWELPEAIYPQPEGITFLPDGTLFISNEARGRGAGTLLRMAPR